jgi:hypothetical protein
LWCRGACSGKKSVCTQNIATIIKDLRDDLNASGRNVADAHIAKILIWQPNESAGSIANVDL